MTGKDLKEKLENIGIPLRKIAESLGISEQNLQNKISAADIKVSLLCKISKVLHKNIYFFLEGQDFYIDDSQSSTSQLRQTNAPEQSGETAAYYRMYKEEKEENKTLLQEIGTLKERLRQLEDGVNSGKCPAKTASSTHTSSAGSSFAPSANAPSKNK